MSRFRKFTKYVCLMVLGLLLASTSVVMAAKIGLLLPNPIVPRWPEDEKHFRIEAESLGDEVISLFAETERLQATQVETMLLQDIDVLALGAMNPKAAKPLVSAAKARGIPVVAYARKIPNADVDVAIVRDDVETGESMAKAAVKAFPKGNYVIARGDEGDLVAHEKSEGYYNILKPYIERGDIKIVSDQYNRGWSPESALTQVEAALMKTGGKIDVVLCNNDGMALGVLQAIKAAGLTGKVFITGQDLDLANAQAIVEGKIALSILTPIPTWAHYGALAAHLLAMGEVPPYQTLEFNGLKDVPTIKVPTIAVTKENMYEAAIKTGWQKLEEVYKNIPKKDWPKPE